MQTGWMYYKKQTEFIKASNVVYLERQLVENFLSNYHHGWMSQETQAESYNETWRSSTRVQLIKNFLAENPSVGAQFKKKLKSDDSDEDLFEYVDAEGLESEEKVKKKSTFCGMFEIHRKNLAQAYYNLWIYEELLERKMIGKYLLGPYYRFEDGEKKLFKYKDSVEQFLALVDCLRVNETYSHTSCAGTFQFKLF